MNDEGGLKVPTLEVAAGLLLELERESIEDHGPATERRRQAWSACLTPGKRQRVRVCDRPRETPFKAS